MKSFTIGFILAVAFVACGCAAPQETPGKSLVNLIYKVLCSPYSIYDWNSIYNLLAVDPYKSLEIDLDHIKETYPESAQYIDPVKVNVQNQEKAAESNNKPAMARYARIAGKLLKNGAHSVESNGRLFDLANVIAKNAFEDLAAGFAMGTKTAADQTELIERLTRMIDDALAYPFY